jgi:hypothetical protein
VASEVKSRISVPVVIVLVVALTALGLWWNFASQPRQAPEPAAITAEAKAYVRNLRLSGVEMKATQNFAGGTVVEIIGNITNGGDRTLNRVELNCVFYDAYGQLVLRERVPIVRSALEPQAQRTFRLPFEGIPASWNQALPQLVIASISFAQ